MTYKIHYDGVYTTIERSRTLEEDGVTYFSRFGDAKEVALSHIRSIRDDYNYCIEGLKELTVKKVIERESS